MTEWVAVGGGFMKVYGSGAARGLGSGLCWPATR